jgi:hypothetical protein
VSAGLDRMFTLLQLQGAYDSNELAARLFEISNDIREKSVSAIPAAFENHLLAELAERRATPISQSFTYALFRPMSIDRINTRFTRYFFGRIERLLARGMKLKMKHTLRDLVTLRGSVNGFHIEHILSQNSESHEWFKNVDGIFDEERFNQERNRLGAVLLLKGRDNISSNNEVFVDKLRSYANTLYWNETLRADTYKSKLDFAEFCKAHQLVFRAMAQFGPEELEERQRLLFDLVNIEWQR